MVPIQQPEQIFENQANICPTAEIESSPLASQQLAHRATSNNLDRCIALDNILRILSLVKPVIQKSKN